MPTHPDELLGLAFCPHPPLLVPELARGAASELDDLRAVCRSAVDVLLGLAPDVVVLVGGGADAPARYPSDAVGSMAGFGVDVRSGTGTGVPVLPLSLTVGAWLLDEAGYAGRRDHVAVPPSGAGVPPVQGRAGWLVLGDASACRTPQSPGAFDARAGAFDAEIASALSTGDPGRLAAFDPVVADELRVAGAGPWRAAARAWGARPARASLLLDEAPYGVGYLVATWLPG